MTPKNKVEIFCCSNSIQLQLIYTGLRMLEEQGDLELSYQFYNYLQPAQALEALAWPPNLLVRLNDSKLLLFDMNDNNELWQEDLGKVDFYFKRGFSAQEVGPELAYKKVFPFGLNYMVYERHPGWFSLRRVPLEKTISQMIKSGIRTLGWLNWCSARNYRAHVGNLYAEPDPALPARVIFMTRLWDPAKYRGAGREITEAINEMRAACIRQLRQEFGPRFMGGLAPGGYMPPRFADCRLKEASQSYQGNYLRLLKQYPIAVASTGLANSTGFKFAEYLAFSRAIVAEKLHYEAPGLEAGKHYLEFSNAEQCVEAVSTLMNDELLRFKMMEQAHAYYQEYLRPDVAVRRALAIALA